jgi:iron complex outermembrane receptor protein
MQEGGTGSTGSNVNGALTAGLLPEEIPDVRSVVYRTPQGREDSKHWGITGDIGVDLGPVNIGYVGSYRYLDYNQTNSGQAGVDFPGRTDYDVDNAGTTYWHQTSKSVTQELRVFSPDTSRFRWSVGGFFFNEEQKTHFATTNDKSNGFFGVEFTMPKMHSRSWAGFADGTFDILKELRVTAGVRGTTEEKSRDGIGNVYSFGGITDNQRFGTDGFAYADQGRTLYSITDASKMAPFDVFRNGIGRFGQRDTLSNALAQPGVTFTGSANEQHGSYSDKFFDFRVGVDGNLTKNNLLYALFSTGHKSGGFNDNVVFPSGATLAPKYKPEVVYAVEVGSKNELLNKLLIANASAFYYSYQDLQLQQVVAIGDPMDPTRAPPASAVRSNAAQSRVMGLELEGTGRLPAGFTLRVSGLLMDARFTEGDIADTRISYDPATQGHVSLKDKFLPRAPVLSVNYGIGQNIQTSIGYFDWVVNFQTKSKYYMTPFNGDGFDSKGNFDPNTSDVVKGFTRFDLGAGFTHVSGKVRFEGFINNVTDRAYMTSLINTPGLNLRFYNPPRQMGLRLTVFM